MEAIGAEKRSPYHGIWVIILISIAMPVGLFALLFACFQFFNDRNVILNIYGSIGFSSLATTIFHLSCMIAGLWNEPVMALFHRIGTFITYFPLIKKKAFRTYFDSMKEDGVVLWIYLFFFLSTLAACIVSAILYFQNI